MRLTLLGPPGAGKGSFAQVLSARIGIAHVASGDLLREAVRMETECGRQAQHYMQRGELVPDTVVGAMMLQRLAGLPREGFVLDGFPRTQAQALELDQALLRAGMLLDRAVYFETSLELLIRRLAGRRVCRTCGTIYHMTNMRPRREAVCDHCGGVLELREDDDPATIAQRLRVDEAQTAPLLTYYRQQGILRTVDGNLSIEELFTTSMAMFRREGLWEGDDEPTAGH